MKVTAYVQIPALRDTLAEKAVTKNFKMLHYFRRTMYYYSIKLRILITAAFQDIFVLTLFY